LMIQTFRMPVLFYWPDPKPPGEFQVFRPSGPPSTGTSDRDK
jgi:hypothetical protein